MALRCNTCKNDPVLYFRSMDCYIIIVVLGVLVCVSPLIFCRLAIFSCISSSKHKLPVRFCAIQLLQFTCENDCDSIRFFILQRAFVLLSLIYQFGGVQPAGAMQVLIIISQVQSQHLNLLIVPILCVVYYASNLYIIVFYSMHASYKGLVDLNKISLSMFYSYIVLFEFFLHSSVLVCCLLILLKQFSLNSLPC